MDALLRRREMMSRGLPYTPVEYIQTDGTAYINTGIKGNTPKSVEFTMTPVQPAADRSVFGVRKDSGNTRFNFLTIYTTKKAGYGYYSGSFNPIDITDTINNHTPMEVRCSFGATSQTFEVRQQGESSYSSYTSAYTNTVTTGMDMFILRMNYAGNPSSGENGMRFHRTKIYSDANYSTLIWDGVPCYYNGEYGMWDKVSDTFFGNAAGSGTISGPTI